MKKSIYLIFLSFIIFGCGGCEKAEIFEFNEINIVTNNQDDLDSDIQNNTYDIIGETYGSINKSTSHYTTQKTNRYISYDDIINKLNVTQQNPQVYWHTNAKNFVIDDFDKNGKLDIFGFWFKSTPNYTNGHNEPGKYFLYLDYFTDNSKSPISWDTNIVYAVEMVLSDIDGDGSNEIISISDDDHDVRKWEDEFNISQSPIEIVKLDKNLNFSKKYVGINSKAHDSSLGDVDNDGDVDILLIPFGNEDYKFPILFRNDGIGNFVSEKLFINESIEQEYLNFYSLAYELFDINGDGYLDIINSSKLNIKRTESYTNPPSYDFINQSVEIFWGDGSGNFDIGNKTKLEIKDNFGYELAVLGYGFSDYDNDGDVDVFLTTTRAEEWRLLGIPNVTEAVNSGMFYNNYIIYGFENNNGDFIDVSDNIFDYRKDMTLTKYSSFYGIYTMDIDNDGDYDLVPAMNHAWTEYRQLSLLYWEKNGSTYTRKEIQ